MRQPGRVRSGRLRSVEFPLAAGYGISALLDAAEATWNDYETLKRTGVLGVPSGSDRWFGQLSLVEKVVGFERLIGIDAATNEKDTKDIVDPFAERRREWERKRG